MNTQLHGLGIQFYRGIGSNTQFMAPFKKFNFFIGANNAGKSTILNCLISRPPFNSIAVSNPSDIFKGAQSGETTILIGIKKSEYLEALYTHHPRLERHSSAINEILNKIINNNIEYVDTLWVFTKANRDNTDITYSLINNFEYNSFKSLFNANTWQNIWQILHPRTGGGDLEHWVTKVVKFLAENITEPNYSDVKIIPAIRQIGSQETTFRDFSGEGLIERLAEIQSPDHTKQSDRLIFHKINDFLRSVLNKKDCSIEIPHHREYIIVHIDNKVLPLSSLGTGIHEIIMIAAFCTISENTIMCIEEPEIHLHPLLQKKLINYLSDNTNNQYFIATHSASFIDTPESAIFHVNNDGDQTYITETILRADKFSLCQDLGYKASDIMQSNAIIWVEGPSDRIYIKHWISTLAPELLEGIHFSIMFYGGRLLSHLCSDPEELDDFISLRSLNHNMAVVIDSDKTSAQKPLNETKKRIQTELSSDNSRCWITAGREIENYIEHDTLQKAVKEKYQNKYTHAAEGGKYDHALYYYNNKNLITAGIDKVAIARTVCSISNNLDVLDLRDRITDMVNIILRANNI